MDRSEGPRSARYRRRLYRGYLWIALIPFSFFVVLGGAAIFLSQNIVIRELSSLKERNLRQVAENIELWFSEADSIALGLSTDPELSRGAEYLLKTGIPSHSDLKLSRTLQSLLASAVNARLYLHSITVTTDSSAGYMITSTEGLIRLDDYSDSEWLRGTEDHMDEITPWTVARDFTPLPNFPLRIPILSFYRNMLGTGSLERKGVLSVNVDVRKLEALLEKSAEAAGGRFILVDRSNGKPLAGMKLGMGEESLETFLSGAGGDDYFVASLDSERFPFTYYLLSPAEEFRRIPRRITLIGGALATLALAVGIALALALARRNFRLLDGILDIVEAAGQGKPLPPFRESRNEALDYVSLAVLKTFVEHDYYKIRLSERELRQRTLELTALQAQMNPHFLLNTLNTGIQLAIVEGAERTGEYMEHLSKLFRHNMREKNVVVPLRHEVEGLESFFYILRVRFPKNLDLVLDFPADILDAYTVPASILQPLVENCIVHAFKGKDERNSIIVRIYLEGRHLFLSVSDNGAGMGEERIRTLLQPVSVDESGSKVMGLENVIQRLYFFFPDDGEVVKIRSVEGEGTEVLIRIDTGKKICIPF